MEYRNGNCCTLEELLAFGDRVFGEEVQPGGFAAVLPKLAGERGIPPTDYRVLWEKDGGLRAMLLAPHLTLQAGGEALRTRYIGSVSVAPEAQGRGLMQELLGRFREELRAEGAQLAVLGGQRQRYAYFGFEPAGLEFRCTLTAANVRHAWRDAAADGIGIAPLAADSPELAEAFALSESARPGVPRDRASFLELLRSWRASPYLVTAHGAFAGYLTVGPKSAGCLSVHELRLTDNALLPAVCKAVLARLGADVLRFGLPLYDRGTVEALGNVCESYEIGCNHSYLVLDFAAVLRAFLRVKGGYAALADGECAFDIEGERFRLRVAGKTAETLPLEAGKPAVALSRRQAIQWMFSPLGYAFDFPGRENVPADWFPLPLFLPLPDAC